MSPARLKWIVRLALAAGLALALGSLWWARLPSRISTDVLDLVPEHERDPQMMLVRKLASQQQGRVALFALEIPDEPAKRQEVAARFGEALRQSGAFVQVQSMQEKSAQDELGAAIFRRRFDLLLPAWLETQHARYKEQGGASVVWSEWLAEDTAAALERFLAQPEAVAFQDLVPADPLLLMPRLIENLQGFQSPGTSDGPQLVWALASGSPLEEAEQARQLAAVDAAIATLRAQAPAARLRWTSVARFAAESRRRIQAELSLLNSISLVAVVLLAALALRNMFKAVHLLPVIAGGTLGAWVVTLASFPRVHVLVFVVGSLLAGVAVDYGFYLYLQPRLQADETYWSKARRLLKPLLASALTTVLGFLLLLFSDLPMIRQLGVFVSAGLLAALACALLWFGQIGNPFMDARAFLARRWTPAPSRRRTLRISLAIAAAVCLFGLGRLHWRDDIRQLEIPATALQDEARFVREQFGETPQRTVYVTHGANPAEAREALARFEDWHRAHFSENEIVSLGAITPRPGAWSELVARRAELGDFVQRLGAALERHGFSREGFDPFAHAWREWLATPLPSYEAVVPGATAPLPGPLGMMFSSTPDLTWFVSVANHPAGELPPDTTATVPMSQLETLNQLFGRYRRSALNLSALGLGLIGLSVLALYGFRHGVRIFALPAGSCLLAFGVLGWVGQTLNMFHLLGAFLGVCLSHNYAIFSAENALRGATPPPSIRLSALTTALSFGVLGFSQIPVVAALGTTVALIVLLALVSVEFEPIAGFHATPSPSRST